MSTSVEVPWWVTAPPPVRAEPRLRRHYWALTLGIVGGALLAGGVLAVALWPGEPAAPEEPPAVAVVDVLPEPGPPPEPLPEVVVLPAPEPAPEPAEERPLLPPPLPEEAAPREPAPAAKPQPATPPRRAVATEDDLRRQLALTPEIGLGEAGRELARAYGTKTRRQIALSGDPGLTSPMTLVEIVPEAATTLPLRGGAGIQLDAKAAGQLGVLAAKLKAYLALAAPPGPDGKRSNTKALAEALRAEKRGKQPEWLRVEAVPALLQLLTHEEAPVRRMLVEMLTEIPERAATEALARRAVYDLDGGIRQTAAAALRGRPAAVWRPVLLEALRYPWAPVADHAAEALVALSDKEAVPALVTQLKLPDPAAPQKLGNGRFSVREVVRAVHLTNCLLCHPPATTGNEPVLGVDPVQVATRGEPCGSGYGGGQSGRGSPASPLYRQARSPLESPLLIRGDITFLRQDFSVQLPLVNAPRRPGPVPELRYDFLVRTRRLTRSEVARLPQQPPADDYPQRDAVLFALRHLTGSDPGPTTAAWQARFPTAEGDVEAARLADGLVHANPMRLGILLRQLRQVPDETALLALTSALPRMRGDLAGLVRSALDERRSHPAGKEKPAADLLALAELEEEADDEKLYVASPLTEDNAFTAGIEGPACDAKGNVYAVNFARQQTIGKVTPDGKGEVFVELPGKSTGNGIVFDPKGIMYVADYVGHNVLRIDPATRKVTVFAHEDKMSQPNDLAIAPDGTLYASDPDWDKGTGRVWRIDTAGKVHLAADGLGTANGIEVSPDGKTLYVNESKQRNVWAFTVGRDGTLSGKRLLKKFDDHGFDGMRCDVDGNLYITRYGKGTVAVLSSEGKLLREIDVLGPSPSNLCFGGPDGRTVYVTEVSKRRLVQFRVERPGLAWQRWRDK
jgi:sugar lactone lactonase YvrE